MVNINIISFLTVGDDDIEIHGPDYDDDPADLQLLQDVGKWVRTDKLYKVKVLFILVKIFSSTVRLDSNIIVEIKLSKFTRLRPATK